MEGVPPAAPCNVCCNGQKLRLMLIRSPGDLKLKVITADDTVERPVSAEVVAGRRHWPLEDTVC